MAGETDQKDKTESRKVAISLLALVILLGIASVLMIPFLGELAALHLSPGLGLRDAAVLSFFTTVVLMIIFALAAGDGFLGEVQFMLAAFSGFFITIWLLLAWIF